MALLPFKVKSIYEYTSEHEDDLNFPIGQVITVKEFEGDDWYIGEYTDATGAKKEGLFPTNFVEKYEPEVPVRPTRSGRPKQEIQQSPVAATQALAEEDEIPRLPAAPTPAASMIESVPIASRELGSTSITSSTGQQALSRQPESAPASHHAESEPPEPAPTPSKKAPPPKAPKSNAFKDRIAAFNQPAAAPIAPILPGRQPQASSFIKKPFVAPPPSKNAYIPPVKSEPVHIPYVREEDPEIKQREEEDRVAAEAAGFGNEASAAMDAEEDAAAPKPLTLKERMAMLQKQQQEQAERRAETTQKKERKPPPKKASTASDHAAVGEADDGELERVRSDGTERESADVARERPRVPSAQRRVPEPVPTIPSAEIVSDGHEADQSGAGELTEDDSGTLGPDRDDSDDRPSDLPRHPAAPRVEADVGDEQDTTEENAEDDVDDGEEEMDEETRRKAELRARMARLGGGFNPFGAPAPAPTPTKRAAQATKSSGEGSTSQALQQQQRISMIPIPGLQRVQSPESDATQRVGEKDGAEVAGSGQEEDDDEEDQAVPPPPRKSTTMERGAPPPVPKDSRPVPPPPPAAAAVAPPSPGPGSESDDEMSAHPKRSLTDALAVETLMPTRSGPPPIPGSREVPSRLPQSPDQKRASYFTSEPSSATSDKRASRPPPVPGSPLASPRPPPPPPPTQAPPSRQSTSDDVRVPLHDEDERVGSEYDGDYDTDIASSAKHKDALKAPHNRDSSLTDDSIMAGEDTPISSPPPLPQASAPRAVPPPPPPSAVPRMRQSMDRPPPPLPPSQSHADDAEYDPYRYPDTNRAVPQTPAAAPPGMPPLPPSGSGPAQAEDEDDLYATGTPQMALDLAPPPPAQERTAPLSVPAQAGSRQSTDINRSGTVRRSMEQRRPSGEHGQIASDLNLPHNVPWWTAENPLPPELQPHNGIDILSESEESSKTKRGGRKEITKDIYILYMDYSQTVISARYDSHEFTDVNLEQRHEPPPPRLRQDQLEAAWQRFGSRIADAAASYGNSKKDAIVADGSAASLPFTLIRQQADALLPVGTRAYGALVYANLANASTMQFDEIRRGDIITVRNAKFEGHHGAMKSKYKVDYGIGHVAIVEEWDGTRRQVRAWEQGREKKGGVRSEKFRLADLRSGEVRIWRVVGRDWVGWDS